jgi:phosphohistidine phosphatase
MLIYFFRHASAGKSMLNPKKDERRPLDEEGILQVRYVGRLLANMEVQVDQIISSPLKRARQTASLAANELAFEGAVQLDDALRPDAGFEDFHSMLARYKKYDAIMVVGHNPSFTEFLSKSISGPGAAARIDLKKGSVARVEMNGRTGTLDWLMTPKIARTLQTSLKSSSRPNTSRK